MPQVGHHKNMKTIAGSVILGGHAFPKKVDRRAWKRKGAGRLMSTEVPTKAGGIHNCFPEFQR
jgi:hypothetical protein